MTEHAIPAARYADRLRQAADALASSGYSALLVGVGSDLRWLTGYAAKALPRLTLLVVTDRGRPTLIVPRLEVAAAQVAPAVAAGEVEVRSWHETEDPIALVADAVRSGAGAGGPSGSPVMLVSDRLWATFVLRLQAVFPAARFSIASEILSPLRQLKDSDEIALLRRAAEAADRTVRAIASGRLVGRTEADVAREVRERLVGEGHDDASFWIVASGPNSASPHHDPADRVIAAGDPIVLDIGGTIEGYGSDITRTLWVTGREDARPDAEFARLYGVLQAAQRAAAEAARPGVPCEAVDRTARDLIAQAGYGDAFIHRTGHGIGLDGHEDPYLVAGNTQPLRDGNAFSVEPGIYLDGRYGARIEDIVVSRASGSDVLNQAPRELFVVSGV